MTVLEDAPGLYEVVSDSGKSYDVEPDLGVCSCPDHEYRAARCIHLRRVDFATGAREIPAWADRDAVDEQLGIHVEGGPAFASDARAPLPDGGQLLPEITEHVEPAEQGGETYHRCEGCGSESIYGAESIVHTDACPRRADR